MEEDGRGGEGKEEGEDGERYRACRLIVGRAVSCDGPGGFAFHRAR